MPTRVLIKPSEYHDSVTLMETASELRRLPGIVDAALVMGSEANLSILRQAGLLPAGVAQSTANDLVLVVRAESDLAAERAIESAQECLAQRAGGSQRERAVQPRSIRAAVRGNSAANLAMISVAGRYAAAEAWEALKLGLHVFLFSDNVSLEDEVALKRYAADHELFLMGPDCGTAILNGVALGFANVVPRGPVGIVSASGTGLQEVSTLLAKMGIGISQGIGTGGRDLKREVGGIMMLEGVRALQSNPDTSAVVLISKPPTPSVAERVLEQVRRGTKPAVVCFLGGDPAPIQDARAIPARTLQEAAYRAAALARGDVEDGAIQREIAELRALAAGWRERLLPSQRYLRGLFSGGTLATEGLVIWQEVLGDVWSNVPLSPAYKLEDATRSKGHCAVDLGEDEFTVGRLHPMLDNDLRIRRLMQEAQDPQVAVLVLDVVLGYGVHPDPAGELGPAIHEARERAAGGGRELIVIASVTGTEEDPQKLSRQVQILQDAGAIVVSSNAAAARLAGFIVAGEEKP